MWIGHITLAYLPLEYAPHAYMFVFHNEKTTLQKNVPSWAESFGCGCPCYVVFSRLWVLAWCSRVEGAGGSKDNFYPRWEQTGIQVFVRAGVLGSGGFGHAARRHSENSHPDF